MPDPHEQSTIPSPRTPSNDRLSALAVVAFVFGLVPCCPPLNLLGSMLGLMAYRRIIAARGRLKGLNLARTAIFSGIILSMLSIVLWSRFTLTWQQRLNESMIRCIDQTMQAAIEQQEAEVMANWSNAGGPGPDADSVRSFGRQLEERYGRYKRFTIVAQTREQLFTPRIQAAVIFHFDDVALNGAVELDLFIDSLDLEPEFRVRSIVVEDPESGDLVLPPANESP